MFDRFCKGRFDLTSQTLHSRLTTSPFSFVLFFFLSLSRILGATSASVSDVEYIGNTVTGATDYGLVIEQDYENGSYVLEFLLLLFLGSLLSCYFT